MVDSEVGTLWRGYPEESKENTDIMENLKYQTVKDGVGHYLDAQARVNWALHKEAIYMKKKLAI